MTDKDDSPLGFFGLIASFGVIGLIKAIVYPLVGIPLFGMMGLAVFYNGPGATESELGVVLRILMAVIIVPSYAIVGGVGSFVLAVTGTILGHTGGLESLLNQMVNPIMSTLVTKLSPADGGIPVDAYLAQLDAKIALLRKEKAVGFSGPSRWLYGVILRIFRRFAAKELLQDLRDRNETLVTRVSLERFMREGLVSYLREEFEDQLDLIRYAIYAVMGIMAAYPVYLWLT